MLYLYLSIDNETRKSIEYIINGKCENSVDCCVRYHGSLTYAVIKEKGILKAMELDIRDFKLSQVCCID